MEEPLPEKLVIFQIQGHRGLFCRLISLQATGGAGSGDGVRGGQLPRDPGRRCLVTSGVLASLPVGLPAYLVLLRGGVGLPGHAGTPTEHTCDALGCRGTLETQWSCSRCFRGTSPLTSSQPSLRTSRGLEGEAEAVEHAEW